MRKANMMRSGISLLEVALFITIAGAVIIGGLKAYEAKKNYDLVQDASQQMLTIKQSIEKFKTAGNGQLPCAASLTAEPGSEGFGRPIADCTNATVTNGTYHVSGFHGLGVRIGALPVRALGLPDSAMFDGWGNRIVYAMTENLSLSNPSKNSPGALTIQDTTGNSISSDATGGVIYLAFSPGADSRGAYNVNGQLISECDLTSIAGENCDNNDALFKTSAQKNSGDNKLTSLFIYGTRLKKAVAPNYSVNPADYAPCNPSSAAESSACDEHPPSSSGLPSDYVFKSGSIIKQHSMICPSRIWSDWEIVSDTCEWEAPTTPPPEPESCTPTSETRNEDCAEHPPAETGLPPEYVLVSGNITQKRDTTCPGGAWGDWYQISSTCYWSTSSACGNVGNCTYEEWYNTASAIYSLSNSTCAGQALSDNTTGSFTMNGTVMTVTDGSNWMASCSGPGGECSVTEKSVEFCAD